ncbi:F0F1 ATP synthase subunit B [Flavobacterium sp. F-328]|jgi:F-type H+-transporting ATPase subunit b|uniref:ATP synthase subunit b n=2 Tax=Flavobacterium TaxID=237 RepID=A0ABR7JBX8_9FLAO|nr:MULTISPECIES: F0F1 ATP synthase subunit B [Flavobacterium]MBC5862004.1 F0F1 ATP synthase subunit B [Flavobacterium turcicum]MBQ0909504.1 F0F1 ATP synthase subunit B [Flavobacterium erciyesense]MCF6139791.1 F0F1 ATP synthase subunit B [Flavobacterium sp. K77]NHL00735.1 F0F1 ATP synthase subunit B [Flavobacterium turcicum]
MNLTAPESLIFWTSIIFIVFFILLGKFAWKPILSAVKGREDSINSALAAAETARLEMQNLTAENERILQEARLERDALLKEARDMREKMIADSKADAQAEGARMIEQAKTAIAAEKNAAMAELKSQVSTLSLSIAEKVLREELSNKESQTKLIENMLGDVKLN